MSQKFRTVFVLLLVLSLAIPFGKPASPASAEPFVNFTILHTNDFHGNLQLAGSNPGAARVAQKIADVRAAVGTDNVLLFDGGDMMQGSLISNLQKGLPTIDYYRTIGYDAATFGNHEFDWGQTVLSERIAQAEAPAAADERPMQMIAANITRKDASGNCTWEPFNSSVTPYEIFTMGTAPNQVDVGVIGVGSIETPYITIAEATEGLCFRDPLESILHYYDALDAASDVIVVISHNGFNDGGYGYGFTVYGDQTLAANLNAAGKPANLIIGGHSHTDVTSAVVVGGTYVVQAHYAGRKVGRADISVDLANGAVTINWSRIVVGTSDPEYQPIKNVVDSYVNDPAYQAQINQPVGYVQVDLKRNYNGDNMMGSFVQDALYNYFNEDASLDNDIDMFFNNAGGIRIDWCDKADPANPGSYIWSSDAADCADSGLWSHDPMLMTYGMMFQILPFGNATAIGEMTGAQIYDLLNQSATLFKGALQPAGIRYDFYRYADALPGPQPYAWGAYNIEVYDRASSAWMPLDYAKTYKVGTNEFLAPAGQDGFVPFKYLANITYWGDMLDSLNAYAAANYTADHPYRGPNGDGQLDGRISRNGNGNDTYEAGEVVPLTVLHHNDSHGRLLPTLNAAGQIQYVGYDQLVTLIKQQRQHNPDRTLLVSAGDNVQGDSMMYYFKSAGLGYAADGTPLPEEISINPLLKAFNAVGYDAMTLGNHEFNFGKEVFGTLADADFPILQANIEDDGQYGLAVVPVEPYTTVTVGPEGIDVAILGIGNHRVPSYELPSNIPGLTFTDPIQAGIDYAPTLQATHDAVVALTHIGFTTDPKSVEVDNNVDTYFAAQVPGVDAVIGGHSHTDPSRGQAPYKYLPAFVAEPNNVPVVVTQVGRYNAFLGEVVLGLLPDGSGGYSVVSRSGRYLSVPTLTAEDSDIKALVQPYQDLITAYNNTVIGQTNTVIDATTAFIEETTGANLQADASVWKLESEGIDVDFHLSGAMTNRKVPDAAAPEFPYTLKVSDMFGLMPYENSLLVMEMNGPQLKAVLERAYRNYYYYKYVPGYGGYSYYTTCMLDTNMENQIHYRDTYPDLPDGNNVLALVIGGKPVDFNNADKYYRVSSVNYLAAGACNFSEGGQSLWPLGQIAADTQYYVRDAVIEYIQAQTEPVNPTIEGRLRFPVLVSTPVVDPEPSLDDHPVTATATFTDPAPDSSPYTCTVDYGDGKVEKAGTVAGTTCTGPQHVYTKYGTYKVTVKVTDANGWTGVSSVKHTVIYNFTGFAWPLKNPPELNKVKVPGVEMVRFSLNGYQGRSLFAKGYPQVQQINCTTLQPIGKPETAFSPALAYLPKPDQYVYFWSTRKAWAGTCRQLVMKLNDGTTHTVNFKFYKR